MSTLMIELPEEVARVMKKYSDVNWKHIAEQSVAEHAKKLELADELVHDSKLTEADVEELDRMLKRGLAQRANQERVDSLRS